MSCEGIWKVEMKGPYGWERIGVAFMKNGEYLAGGPNHYSVGSYKVQGDTLEISVTVAHFDLPHKSLYAPASSVDEN